ncbi:hypothetical protein BC941DRAFT_420479 [Chlamydoabsidia padenii]|nr:hypothetical protein BC941DRAFT_420479 [Chlamydoabsidia padenii]
MIKSKTFVQTKLNFGKFTTTPTQGKDPSIEERVSRLKLGSKHPIVCPTSDCKDNAPKILCTSTKADGSACLLSWCDDCLGKISNERLEDIKKNNSISTDTQGNDSGVYALKEGSYQWDCPVCRKLCVCSYCTKPDNSSIDKSKTHSTPIKSDRIQHGRSIQPPEFSSISLVYPEEEIWTRLQIREFIYQFGDICQLEPRVIQSLQNIQGDWRIRRLSAILVWQALVIIGNFSMGNNNNSNNSSIDSDIQRSARQIANNWATDFELTRTAIPNTKERLERTGELLSKKGVTCDKWQDVAELLAKADFKDLPIPTSNLVDSLDVSMEDQLEASSSSSSSSSMDFENEYDTVDYQIKKFRALKRSPLSTQEELHMVEMLLDLVLLDGRVRQQIMEATKHTKATKDFKIAFNLQRHQLNLNRQMDTYIHGAQDTSKETCLEVTSLERNVLEAMVATMRSDKRLHRLITPWNGNEYWLFHDLLSPQQHIDIKATEQHYQEPYWAHGVIMIGKCPTRNDETGETTNVDQQQRGWWYLYGTNAMRKLDSWLATCLHTEKSKGTIEKNILDTASDDIKLFRAHLAQHIEYLGLLESVIYGHGHFL